MSDKGVFSEIHKIIRAKLKHGVVRVDLVTASILAERSDISGDDAAFYRVCTHRQLRQMVKRAVDKYQPSHETDPQLLMDGFAHLAIAYPLKRQGETVLVPVDLCSDIELLGRAAEMDKISKGTAAHAVELRTYVRNRGSQAA